MKLEQNAWLDSPRTAIKKAMDITPCSKLVDKASVDACNECETRFTAIVVKKHHCKTCGDVYCGNCCSYRTIIKLSNKKKKFKTRMCKKCVDKYSKGDDAKFIIHSEQIHKTQKKKSKAVSDENTSPNSSGAKALFGSTWSTVLTPPPPGAGTGTEAPMSKLSTGPRNRLRDMTNCTTHSPLVAETVSVSLKPRATAISGSSSGSGSKTHKEHASAPAPAAQHKSQGSLLKLYMKMNPDASPTALGLTPLAADTAPSPALSTHSLLSEAEEEAEADLDLKLIEELSKRSFEDLYDEDVEVELLSESSSLDMDTEQCDESALNVHVQLSGDMEAEASCPCPDSPIIITLAQEPQEDVTDAATCACAEVLVAEEVVPEPVEPFEPVEPVSQATLFHDEAVAALRLVITNRRNRLFLSGLAKMAEAANQCKALGYGFEEEEAVEAVYTGQKDEEIVVLSKVEAEVEINEQQQSQITTEEESQAEVKADASVEVSKEQQQSQITTEEESQAEVEVEVLKSRTDGAVFKHALEQSGGEFVSSLEALMMKKIAPPAPAPVTAPALADDIVQSVGVNWFSSVLSVSIGGQKVQVPIYAAAAAVLAVLVALIVALKSPSAPVVAPQQHEVISGMAGTITPLDVRLLSVTTEKVPIVQTQAPNEGIMRLVLRAVWALLCALYRIGVYKA